MVHLTILTVLLLVVLGGLLLRRGPNMIVRRYQRPYTLQWIGLAGLLAFAGFWTWWGVAEMATEPGGFIHLLPILPIALLLYFGWRQPGPVGWGLLLLSVLYPLAVNLPAFLAEPAAWSLHLDDLAPMLLLVWGPLFGSGLCLVIADQWARHCANQEQAASPNNIDHPLRSLQLPR